MIGWAGREPIEFEGRLALLFALPAYNSRADYHAPTMPLLFHGRGMVGAHNNIIVGPMNGNSSCCPPCSYAGNLPTLIRGVGHGGIVAIQVGGALGGDS